MEKGQRLALVGEVPRGPETLQGVTGDPDRGSEIRVRLSRLSLRVPLEGAGGDQACAV